MILRSTEATMGDRDDDEDKGTRVYVGGLNDGVKKEDLEGEFEKFGKLLSVWVAFNPPGFAFIEFCSLSDAETACDNLNGTDFLGSKLRVEIARGKTRRGGFRGGGRGGPPRGGRGGGGGFRSGGGFRDSRGGGSGGSRGFRGGGGGRGGSRGRYDDYGGRREDGGGGGGGGGGGRYSGDFDRNGGRDSFRPRGRDNFHGRGGGGGGRRYEGGDRFRSRSPAGGPRR